MAKEIYRVEIPIVATDKYSDAIRKAEREIKKMLKEAQRVKTVIEVDSKSIDQAQVKLSRLDKVMRKKGELQINLRDYASKGLQSVQKGWDRVSNSRVANLAINAQDRATSVLRSVGRVATSIPAMVSIGIGVVGAAKATAIIKSTIGKAMQSAMDWEVNEVAMMHRLNDDEKAGKHWMKEIGMLADKTPYSSPDLIPAFTQGLTLSKRDPVKAFDYTKIAADMAALTPGRTPEDAMSALLGASMGNYAMLETYGFKITQEIAKQMGGFEGVFKAVVDEYQGGATKLSQTNAGIISTLQGYKGSLQRSFGQGLLKPIGTELEKVSQFIDANQDGWGRTKDVVSSVGLAISTGIVDRLKNTTGYLAGLSDMMMQGIEIKRDDQGTITNANEIGQQALQNLKETKDQVLADLSAWWDTTGKPKAVEVGTALGEGAINALIAGIPMIATALYDALKGSVTNAFKEPSLGSLGGAALTLGGAGMLGMGVGKRVIGTGRGLISAGKWIGEKTNRTRGAIGGYIGTKRERIRDKKEYAKRQISKEQRTRAAKQEMEQASKYSQTPQAYRPPKDAKSMFGFAAAPGGANLFGGAGKLLKGVGGKLPGLNALFAGYDAISGWQDAGNIMGKASDQLTMLDKAGAATAKMLEGFTFGLVKAEKVVDTVRGEQRTSRMSQEFEVYNHQETRRAEEDYLNSIKDQIKIAKRYGDTQTLSEIEGIMQSAQTEVDKYKSIKGNLTDEQQVAYIAAQKTVNAINDAERQSLQSTERLAKLKQEAADRLANDPSASFTAKDVDLNLDVMNEMFVERFNEAIDSVFQPLIEGGPILSSAMDNIILGFDDMSMLIDGPFQTFGMAMENLSTIAVELSGDFALLRSVFIANGETMGTAFENLTMLLIDASGDIVTTFGPLKNSALAENTIALSNELQLIQSSAQALQPNIVALGVNMNTSGTVLELAFQNIYGHMSNVDTNAVALSINLATASTIILPAFQQIDASSNLVNASLIILATNTSAASVHLTTFARINGGVNLVNNALSGLAAKVRAVQVQQSITFSSPTISSGPVKAYAKGGIATSPHIGLVAEAGVDESMIPHDGSKRSKSLWYATGEALGMFNTSTAFDTGATSAATNEVGGNAISVTVPINVVQDADTDAIIQATLNKVAKELREVLETTV